MRRARTPSPACGGGLWRGVRERGLFSALAGALAGLGPAFREGEGAGAERPPLAVQRPGLALGLDAVARQARAERRDQQRAHTVFAAAFAGVGVDEERVADVVPGQRHIL